MVNLELAQAVVSFVVAVPCFVFLLQVRWDEWALLVRGESVEAVVGNTVSVKEALN